MDIYVWTKHVEWKMKYYRLSKQKVVGVLRRPERVERGVVGRTIAAMQPVFPKKIDGKTVWKQELWVMYQEAKSAKRKARNVGDQKSDKLEKLRETLGSGRNIKIISAWRYPGMTRPGESLPDEVWQEIHEAAREE